MNDGRSHYAMQSVNCVCKLFQASRSDGAHSAYNVSMLMECMSSGEVPVQNALENEIFAKMMKI